MGKTKERPTAANVWAVLERSIAWRYTGIGFVWAWIYCSFETSALFPDRQGVSINADLSWLASASVVVVALVVTGIVLRGRDLACLRVPRVTAPFLVAAGTVLSGVAPLFGDWQEAASWVSGALTGVGSAWLIIWWADALSALDIEQLEAVVPVASLITLLCTLVFPYIEGALGMLAVASLPLLSGAMLSLSYRDVLSSAQRKRPPAVVRPVRETAVLLMRLSLVLFASYFVIGCLGALSAAEDLMQTLAGFDVSTFIGSGFGIVLAVCFIFFSMKIDFTSLYRWLSPLLMLSLALFPWQEVVPNFVSTTIVAIADTSMQVIVFIYLISMAKRGLVSTVLGIGLTQGFLQLGVLAGNVTGDLAAPLVADGSLSIFVVVLALMVAFSFSLLLVPQRGRAVGAAKPAAGRSGEEASIEARCRQLTVEHGLSAREAEVLGYLARGRSQPYIREELLLSKNTVATHVKHIYQKLNVHSRQELLDLVQE